MKNDRTSPFEVRISAEVLSDLQQRLANTRWSRTLEDDGWEAGTDVQYLRYLIRYWRGRSGAHFISDFENLAG